MQQWTWQWDSKGDRGSPKKQRKEQLTYRAGKEEQRHNIQASACSSSHKTRKAGRPSKAKKREQATPNTNSTRSKQEQGIAAGDALQGAAADACSCGQGHWTTHQGGK